MHSFFCCGYYSRRKCCEVLLHPHNYCNFGINVSDENASRDDCRRAAIAEVHSALLHTCSHLFQMTEMLSLVSQSSGRPDLISFRSFVGNSNLLFLAPNRNSTSFPDTPQQNSNYQLPLLLSICDRSWPIIKWMGNEVPQGTGILSTVCCLRMSLRNSLGEERTFE